jgi:biotin carboxyl carrier protein
VRATRGGRVAAVGVKAGDQVSPGQWLVRLEGDA